MMGILSFGNYLKLRKFRGTFNGLSILVLFFFLYLGEEIVQNPFSRLSYSKVSQDLGSQDDSRVNIATLEQPVRRKIQENELSPASNYTHVQNGVRRKDDWLAKGDPSMCSGLHKHKGYSTKCEYLKSNPECNAGGFFNYIHFLYCDCEKYKALGYVGLAIWLVALFYVLGNTAADYFCCSLERLSILLRLPPTVAGVTLLPLGNGAPDVFSSIAAFVGRDSGGVGLNSVLGGAVFVTSVVVGTVSLCVADQSVRIDKKCFIRDVCFFMVALFFLLAILIVGKLSVGGAIAFVSIYVVYALFVAATEMIRKNAARKKLESVGPLLPVRTRSGALSVPNRDEESVRASLLEPDSSASTAAVAEGFPCPEDKLPHWVWSTNVAIYSNEVVKTSAHEDDGSKLMYGGWVQWNEEEDVVTGVSPPSFTCSTLCSYLELPLTLPRRLTIPVVDEERWSKFYGVCSVLFAPVLLAFLWNTRDVNPFNEGVVYLAGAIIGVILGVLAFVFTKSDHPPQRFLLPWLFGGFFMSIIWFYIVANELVAVLVAFGVIFGISPSLLALTVLAWGNSIGDLVSNTAMAINGGMDGVQIAISGCYAGPMFNTLAGLGISMLLGAWYKRPAPYTVPKDYTLYLTLGFLTLSLVWSLVVLPCSNMRPNKLLGIGLIAIYVAFLSLRATIAIGDAS